MTNERTITDIIIKEQTITDIINAIYGDMGFKGVIRFLENHVYGGVEKKEDGLYEVHTQGEHDESVIWDIIQPECFFSEHYCGYVRGAKYYFIEDPCIELVICIKEED